MVKERGRGVDTVGADGAVGLHESEGVEAVDRKEDGSEVRRERGRGVGARVRVRVRVPVEREEDGEGVWGGEGEGVGGEEKE